MDRNTLITTFNDFKRSWENTPEFNDKIYDHFGNEVDKNSLLYNHSEYIKHNKCGFGEKPFLYLWAALVSVMNDNFKFLEIGVYKGSILCLVKKMSDELNIPCKIFGLTPLNNAGDKFSSYSNDNYEEQIQLMFHHFNKDMDNVFFIHGLSTDEKCKTVARNNGPFNIIYVDGGHDYETVVNDITLCDEILSDGGYLIFDDASCYLNLGEKAQFHGHIDVANAIRDRIESNKSYEHVFSCGHNRIFKKNKGLTSMTEYQSQHGQDKWIIETAFKKMKNGYFVDLAAGDGIFISNTYVLESQYDWGGICIEANPTTFENLKHNRRCICDDNIIYEDGKSVTFCEIPKMGGKFEHLLSYVEGCAKPHYIVSGRKSRESISLKTLLDKYNCPTTIDYFSLDIEGSELKVLTDFFNSQHNYKILVWTIEETDELAIKNLMIKNGYRFHTKLAGDCVYLHEDFNL